VGDAIVPVTAFS